MESKTKKESSYLTTQQSSTRHSLSTAQREYYQPISTQKVSLTSLISHQMTTDSASAKYWPNCSDGLSCHKPPRVPSKAHRSDRSHVKPLLQLNQYLQTQTKQSTPLTQHKSEYQSQRSSTIHSSFKPPKKTRNKSTILQDITVESRDGRSIKSKKKKKKLTKMHA